MKPHPHKRRLGLLIAGGALALATALSINREPSRSHTETEARSAETPVTPVSSPATGEFDSAGAADSTEPTTARTSRLEQSDNWAQTLQGVLPDLEEAPPDWREFKPEQLRVAVLPHLAVTFTMTAFQQDGERSTWVGQGEIEGATLVAIGTRSSWTASVSFADGNEYLITVAGSRVIVQEANPDLEACGNRFVPVTDILADVGVVDGTAASEPEAAADTIHTSDVLFLYDEATETRVKAELDRNGMSITPAERIDSLVRATIGQANEDLTRSEVTNLRWNVVGVAKVPAYETNGDTSMRADLDAITYTTSETGRFARDKAVELGADQSVLFVSGTRDYAGLAWRPGHHAVCMWGSSHYVVAHELAHNLDCNHDRQTAGAADGGGYSYGHRYTSSTGRDTGTIMSYAGTRVPYFSNPNVTYQGVALGVAAGEPKAADNARTIRENAASMAAYRTAVGAPTITRQPASVSVTAGQAIALSVAATGSGLTYQWYRNQGSISGATADAYRKEGATAADAGDYTVVVTNDRGSVTSSVAAVTVSAGSAGGGGGGSDSESGGGGAPSAWFLAALAALAGLRAWNRRSTS